MRLPRWALALGLLSTASSVAAPGRTPLGPTMACAQDAAEARAAAQAAADELASDDDAVRTKAAARLAALGRVGAQELVRRGAALDDRAWRASAEAFVRAKCSWCAFPFVAAARNAPPPHAKRLLELAHALDPLAGVRHTREETASEVRRLLDEADRSRCATGYEERIAVLGHDAIEPLLAGMRDGDPEHPGGSVTCAAVALLVERSDLPAIRELLLAGKVNLVGAIRRLQREGVPEATDALLDAAAAGRLETRVTRALGDTPDTARVLEVVRGIVASRPAIDDRSRANLAALFQKLDARDFVPTLESWLGTSKDPDTFVAIADALVHFGDPRGVGLLVRIASERRTQFPCRPSTPQELAAAAAPGRLCPEGFPEADRERAALKLSAIAGKEVFDMPEDWYRRLAEGGENRESGDDYLDRAAAAFRAWWATSKDRLRFDATKGRWTVG
jgi:hypothetical protein